MQSAFAHNGFALCHSNTCRMALNTLNLKGSLKFARFSSSSSLFLGRTNGTYTPIHKPPRNVRPFPQSSELFCRRRLFGHIARESKDGQPKPQSQPPSTSSSPKPNPLDAEVQISAKKERQNNWKIIKQLMINVWPRGDWKTRGTVIMGFILLISGKVLNVQVPLLFKEVIDTLNIPFDPASSASVWTVAGTVVLGYGLARIGATVFSELLNAVFANIGQRAIRRVARETFEQLLHMDLRFHLARQTGGLTRAIDRGTKGITFLLQAILFRIVPTALEISLVCGILTYKFGIDFALLTASTLGLYALFTIKTTSWRTRFRREANQADNRAASTAVDSLINYEAVKHFNNERFEVAQYDSHLASYEKSSVKITTSLSFLNSGQNIIFSSALTMTMLMGAQGILNGTMTVGDLVMINQLIFQLSLPLNFLGTIYREINQNLLDMEVLFKLREDNPPIKDSPDAKPLLLSAPSSTSIATTSPGTSITFENVSFSYTPTRPIFTDLSFHIPPGSKVAFVGPSGCGKSTILRLLFRFYTPSGGRILLNNQDISQIQIESLRKNIGIVPQDTPLFHADIMHNIRYGNLEADDDQVVDAAKKANVHDAIMRLPEGYKTKVGERGLMISGGEKQRLAVARVMLKDPVIVGFDEATSALDPHTEASLMRNINSSLLGSPSSSQDGDKPAIPKTAIFIAHRLRTISDADIIFVLKDGEVAEQGTHEELLRKGGVYARMWAQQASAESAFEEGEEAVTA
ncbi:Iron-sulfur clusters transporter atm1, mitochondrial [Stygiomarasmius scandens]|uniref:Iron-sulfur clusters transporter ATM1, mitochondrial n=1 Tax=Marasmiellus scandens TaxID=2682957 RepID=A0ABR1JW05_9AGAR